MLLAPLMQSLLLLLRLLVLVERPARVGRMMKVGPARSVVDAKRYLAQRARPGRLAVAHQTPSLRPGARRVLGQRGGGVQALAMEAHMSTRPG